MTDDQYDLGAVLEHYDVQFRSDRQGEQSIRCPIHEDRVASASLNLDKGIWNCHSCLRGGDALTVITEREQVDFETALKKYESITGGSHRKIRGKSKPRSPVPPGSGYKPRFRRIIPVGLRRKTDYGT